MIKMGFDWGSFFASSVKEAGTVAKAKDVSVAAEAKAQAEEFAEKQEAYGTSTPQELEPLKGETLEPLKRESSNTTRQRGNKSRPRPSLM